MFREMATAQMAWAHIAYFAKRTGQLTMRVPMPYHVRGAPPRVRVKDGYLELEWRWGRETIKIKDARNIDTKMR
jgi:hypothetical protein